MEKNVRLKHRKLYLIFRFLQGSKIYFAAAIAASLISTILNALTPQIFRFSIDEVLSGNIGNSRNGGSYLSSHLWILALMIVAGGGGFRGFFLYGKQLQGFLPISAVPIRPGRGRILLKT